MNKSFALSVLFACTVSFPQAFAGTYGPQNFDAFAVGTMNLNDGSVMATTVVGTTSIQNRPGSTTDRAFRLTQDTIGNTNASWKLPALDVSAEPEGFDVSFKVRQFSTDTLADGFSLSFGAIPGGNDNGGGEAGFTMANGLVLSFDTYVNFAGDAPRIKAFSNGVQVGIATVAFNVNDPNFHNVVIHWDNNGLDLSYDGVALFTNLALPGFFPSPGDRFAFSGRTGGANQETMIDDLAIQTAPAVPISTTEVVITEFLAENGDGIEDEDTDSSDWIELYNGTGVPVDLTGWRLTNTLSNSGLWTFPTMTMQPFTYLRVFASGKDRRNPAAVLHTNFTLPKTGGYLALVKPDGITKPSEFSFGAQSEDVSFGTYGPTQLPQFLIPPTPGAKNERSIVDHADGPPAEDVVFSREGGLITGAVQLGVSAPLGVGAVIRYTQDGTNPDAADPVFDPATPLNINATRNIRARVFQPGRLPGDLNSRSFLLADASLTNYGNTGQPFSSNLPIVVVESWSVNIDAVTNPAGARPYRPIYSVVFAPDPANNNRARITDVPNYEGRGGMHVRGQTSSSFGQKPYAWELWNNEDNDKDASLAGLPEDSDWILQTPYNDKSLMRNTLPYALMREIEGAAGAVQCKFVEVFFNQDGGPISYADYRGVYILMERIQRGTDRVDINKLSPLATDPATITGGYIFKKDKLPVAPMYTTTSTSSWGAQVQEIAEPEDAGPAQISYLQSYVQQFDTALSGPNFSDPTTGFRAFIEPESFMDNHLWVEVFKQIDGYRISTYFTKDRGRKIRALPIWDYNLSGGNANYLTGDQTATWYYTQIGGGDYPYYPRLFLDGDFRTKYWDRYWKYRRSIFTTANIHAKIDAWANELTDNNYATTVTNGALINTGFGEFFPTDKGNNLPPSLETPARAENPAMRHFDRWPILGIHVWPNPVNPQNRPNFQSEIQWMKDWFTGRLNWIDGQNSRPPTFSNSGGNVPPATQLTITNPNPSGAIFYTIDGSDPFQGSQNTITLMSGDALACKWLVPSAANGGTTLTAGAGANQWTGTADPPNIGNWVSATCPIGYDRNATGVNYVPLLGANGNTEAAMFSVNATCYMRVTFEIPDQATLDAIGTLYLGVRYDDGIRAYINGTAVGGGRNDIDPTMTNNPPFAQANAIHDDTAALAYEDIDITALGKPALQVGTNVLAIHGLNSPSTSSDFYLGPRITYIPAATAGGGVIPYTAPLTLNTSTQVRSRVLISGQWSPITEASFVVNAQPASPNNLVVSEFSYDPEASGPYISRDLEFIVLRNISASAVDLTGVELAGAATLSLTGSPQALTLPPGGEVVLAANPAALLAVHGSPPSGLTVFGPFTGALDNAGETIRIETAGGAILKEFLYSPSQPWPNGSGRSVVLLQPHTNPNHSNGHNWRSSVATRGTPYDSDSVGFSGDWTADSDSDGFADGIEYSLGTGPTNPASKPSITLSKTNEVVNGSLGTYLRMAFRRSLLQDQGALVPELTLNLAAWMSGPAAFTRIAQTDHGDGTVTEIWRSTSPIPGEKAFGRLRLVSP
jgi:hypothetical protein